MSQTCSNLATKAELEALAAELETLLGRKVNNVEKASLIDISAKQGAGLALAALAPKIAKALAGLGVLAAKITVMGGAIALLVAQIAALALLQYQINRNKQRINSNGRTIERNTARTLNNQDQINRNKAELAAQRAEIESYKAEIPTIKRQIRANEFAIAVNEAAIRRSDRRIAQNKAEIIQAETRLKNDIATAEADLKRQVKNAEADLQRQVNVAETRLNRKIDETNNFVETIQTGFAVSIADITTRLTSQIVSTGNRLARTQGDVTELQVRLAIANGDATITRRRTQFVERNIESLRASGISGFGTTNFTQTLNNTATATRTNTAGITNSNTRLNDLTSRITAIETGQMDITQTNRLRSDIASDTQTIVAATLGAMVLPRVNELRNQTSPTAISSATNDALCQQANNPSSCLNTRITNPIQNNLGNIASGIGAGASSINTALSTNILNRVTDIQNKVNSSQFGLQATKQFLETAWNATRMDKVLNAFNTILALHNAAMLSRNLVGSVGDTASSLLNAIGIRDGKNEEININQFVTQRIQSMVNATIGTENAQALSTGFNSFNRILVAAQGVVSATRAIKDALQNGQEIIANRIGFLSNSFMEQGILEEGSYPWSDTNISFRRSFNSFTTRVQNIQEIVDEINELVQSGIEVGENVKQISESIEQFQGERQNLENALAELNDEKQEEEDQKEVTNSSPEITNPALVKDED